MYLTQDGKSEYQIVIGKRVFEAYLWRFTSHYNRDKG